MKTAAQTSSFASLQVPQSSLIQTTLYDLIEAISAEIRPGEEALVPAIAVKLLRSHRVKLIGRRVRSHAGYKFSYLNSASA